MRLFFTKMQGLGNDYIYVNCFDTRLQWVRELEPDIVEGLVRKASDRHTGIGGDGVIFIMPSEEADCRMKMYNADGSVGAMCGNGIRCVARYARERGIMEKNDMRIETDSGVKEVYIREEEGKVRAVRVDMGGAIDEGERQVILADGLLPLQLVSVGNPHCVIFTENIKAFPLQQAAEQLHKISDFAEGVNVEIAHVRENNHIEMRVFERGAGETMACGTGACAVCAAAVWQGYYRYDENIVINQPGGSLVTACLADGRVMMEGPAEFVFEGIWEFS